MDTISRKYFHDILLPYGTLRTETNQDPRYMYLLQRGCLDRVVAVEEVPSGEQKKNT